MKHAGPDTLARIAGLLDGLREVAGLVERKPGVFYRKSRAFLHFHEHGDDVYADLRLAGPDFERHRVSTRAEQRALLQAVRDGVGQSDSSSAGSSASVRMRARAPLKS